MGCLTDDDKTLGPLTWGKVSWNNWSIELSSGDDEDKGNKLTVYAFWRVFRLKLPRLIRPYREKVKAQFWDAATIERMGQDWYYSTDRRVYGVSISDGAMHIRYGRSTHDSFTDKSKCYFLPWCDWRFYRQSWYGLDGGHLRTRIEDGRPPFKHYEQDKAFEDAMPKAVFEFADYDLERIQCTTFITEREWRKGSGWFKWLSWFSKKNIQRSLDLDFSSEVGKGKGSWKGGTTGHSIELKEGELHESGFKRYCAENNMTFIGKVT